MTQPSEQAYICTLLIGHKVEVQMLDGRSFEGVFHTANSDASGLSIALKQAREQVKRIERNSLAEKPRKVIVLNFADIAQLRAEDVSFHADDVSGTDNDLRTDDAIGGRGRATERDLMPWMPDPDVPDSSLLSLEDSATGWDQFAVNREKFGVETTFKEELYTSALDKRRCNISEQEAARIAREIETQAGGSTNYHILEERGGELEANEMDEEDRYSSVIRDPRAAAAQRGGGAANATNGANAWQRKPAWGSTGSGVAAVAKSLPPGQQQQQQQQAGQAAGAQKQQPQPPQQQQGQQQMPRSSLTAGLARAGPAPAMQAPPVNEDQFRFETNSVRMQLAGHHQNRSKQAGNDSRTSPYGTPKHSPHFAKGEHLMALNLDPAPRQSLAIDAKTEKDFAHYKESLNKKREQEEQQKRLLELKNAAGKGGSPPEGAAATTTPSTQQQQQPPQKAGEQPQQAQQGQQGQQGQQQEGGTKPQAAAPQKPASKLNPFAKSFSLNAAAKEFVPSFASSSTATSGNTPPSQATPPKPLGPVAAAAAPAHPAAAAPPLMPTAPTVMPPAAPMPGFVPPAAPVPPAMIGPGAVAASVPPPMGGPGYMPPAARSGAGRGGMGGRGHPHAAGMPPTPHMASPHGAPPMSMGPHAEAASNGGVGAPHAYGAQGPPQAQQGGYGGGGKHARGGYGGPHHAGMHAGAPYGAQPHAQEHMQGPGGEHGGPPMHPHPHPHAPQMPHMQHPMAHGAPPPMAAGPAPHPMAAPYVHPMAPAPPHAAAQPPFMGGPQPPQPYGAAPVVPVSAAAMPAGPMRPAPMSGAMMPMMHTMVPQSMPMAPYGAPGYGPMGYGPPMSSMPMMVSAPMHPGSMPMQPMPMQPMAMDAGFGGGRGGGRGGRGLGPGRGGGGPVPVAAAAGGRGGPGRGG